MELAANGRGRGGAKLVPEFGALAGVGSAMGGGGQRREPGGFARDMGERARGRGKRVEENPSQKIRQVVGSTHRYALFESVVVRASKADDPRSDPAEDCKCFSFLLLEKNV
jgi:hypothetical protein